MAALIPWLDWAFENARSNRIKEKSKMMTKVLISDNLAKASADIFRDAGILVDVKPGLSAEELEEIIGDYDGLAIRCTTKVTLELLDKAPRLKVVGRAELALIC